MTARGAIELRHHADNRQVEDDEAGGSASKA
jgi:hypothetical protein